MKKKIYKNQYNDNGLTGQEIFNFIALRYSELKMENKAISIFKQALTYYPLSYNIIFNLAGLYLEKGDKKNAKIYFQKAAEIETNMFELVIDDNAQGGLREITSGSDDLHYENFTEDKILEISKILIQELHSFYRVSIDNRHIFYFLGTIYHRNNVNFFAFLCFLREIKLNKDDTSDFAFFSNIFLSKMVNNLNDFENDSILFVNTVELRENFDKLKIQLKFDKLKNNQIHNLQVLFVVHELICEYLSTRYDITLDKEQLYSILSLSNNDLFKMPEFPEILKEIDLVGVMNIYKTITNEQITNIFQFYEKFIEFNLPLITFPNIDKYA